MITKTALSAWIVLASSSATHGARSLPVDVADAMADAAIVDARNDNVARTIASLEVGIAFYETGGQMVLDPKGPNDGGRSHCWGQVYLPPPARTIEGWTGAELRTDPVKCATVVVRLLKASIGASPVDCPLCVYARGPRGLPGGAEHAWAQRASNARESLARRLLHEIPWTE